MKLLNKVFIGILLCLPLFSFSEAIKDLRVSPFSAANDSHFTESFGEVISPIEVYAEQNNEDTSSPYAPFPWPCDTLEDCARNYLENIGNIENFYRINQETVSPYAPFPWPCDTLEDCARNYLENIGNIENFYSVNQETVSPYAPFPWPCDSVQDCARIIHDQNIGEFTEISAPSLYAPSP